MIRLMDVNKFIKERKLIGPVSSPIIFEILRDDFQKFHPDGLFSERIFGLSGSAEYKERYSWIELNTTVIHPFVYELLKKMIFRKIGQLLSGEKRFSIDKEGRLVEDPSGEISGYNSFLENLGRVSFINMLERSNDEEKDEISLSSSVKKRLVNVIESAIKSKTFFTERLLVVPPFFRPISYIEGEMVLDAMNDIYIKVINQSNQLKKVSGVLKEVLSYNLQVTLSELYDYSKNKLEKKSGLVRSFLLGRRTDFSARSVISPNPYLPLGYVGVPFRIVCQLFEPFIIYGLVNSPYASKIPKEFYEEVKRFLGKERLA